MLSREELKKTVTRIFDSLRKDKEYDGLCDCRGIRSCSKCPFDGSYRYCFDEESIDNVLNSLEYIESWAKEHPIVTYEQKYEETFGVKPKNKYDEYLCPHNAGFTGLNKCESESSCAECKKNFWESEYKEPKKEEDNK